MSPTFLSLFSGIGGLDLGLERAGWTCVGQVEVDPFCQRVLARHWPDVPRWGDIKELDPHDLPWADLICAGFPCQPVSFAGRRLGQEDERWLWPEVARFVRILRPPWLLLENVPGLLARGIGDVLLDLARCGYDAEWDCISAADVGAPHLRERVWVVAYPERPGRDGLHERQQPRYLAADAGGRGCYGSNGTAAEDHRGRVQGDGSQGGPATMADPDGQGRDIRPWVLGQRRGLAQPPDSGRWAPEPDVGRVVDGTPTRMDRDRVRALGNAVVPQVAELIGRLILAAHQEVPLEPAGTNPGPVRTGPRKPDPRGWDKPTEVDA